MICVYTRAQTKKRRVSFVFFRLCFLPSFSILESLLRAYDFLL